MMNKKTYLNNLWTDSHSWESSMKDLVSQVTTTCQEFLARPKVLAQHIGPNNQYISTTPEPVPMPPSSPPPSLPNSPFDQDALMLGKLANSTYQLAKKLLFYSDGCRSIAQDIQDSYQHGRKVVLLGKAKKQMKTPKAPKASKEPSNMAALATALKTMSPSDLKLFTLQLNSIVDERRHH